jgi:hypothetical protein
MHRINVQAAILCGNLANSLATSAWGEAWQSGFPR